MKKYKIEEKDIKEKFLKSSKKGGTKSDKTANSVYLKHLPTGTEVKCSQSRSRSLNRFLARRRLVSKIEDMIKGRKSEKQKKNRKNKKAETQKVKKGQRKNFTKEKDAVRKKKIPGQSLGG
ncbi:MAG: peptide chain release factor family protein [Elusimicrobiota bacterium]